MNYLIRSKGQAQLVASLDGYPQAKVIAENVPDPPDGFCHWDDDLKEWIADAPPPTSLEERVAALEREVAQLKGTLNVG